ncbi:DUF3558 family protein [Herbihabitans rhizosphaerae]|nr:DUF3558 family protein [Herbihabitans rhizosphaerae]
MSHRASRVAMLAALVGVLALLAGCGQNVDLGKSVSTRTSVPAGGPDNGPPPAPPGPNDPVFSPDRLRTLDPCGLIDQDLLKTWGTPARNYLGGYIQCSNFMKDQNNKSLSVTIYTGQNYTAEMKDATKNIEGIPARVNQSPGSTACFVDLVVSVDPPRSVRIQTDYSNGDPCSIGRKVAQSVVKRLRAGTQPWDAPAGSTVRVDPCTLVDEASANLALGGVPKLRPYELHQCNWQSPQGSSRVTVILDLGTDPNKSTTSSAGVPVDLGGVKVFQKLEQSSYAKCEVTWAHRAAANGKAELVSVSLYRSPMVANEDVCGKTHNLARLVMSKLPKA